MQKYWCNILFILIFTSLAILFYTHGEIDLAVSNYFFDPLTKEFYLANNWFVQLIHEGVWKLVFVILICLMIAALKKFLIAKSLHLKHYIAIIYITLVGIVGPGIIINVICKDHFGRARPHQIEEFGSMAHFTPAFAISNQCISNCSFVSGHASIGFLFCAFGFLYHDNRRIYFNILGITLGSAFGLARIMHGKHFLSDVIFSGMFVYITAYLLAKLLLKDKKYA